MTVNTERETIIKSVLWTDLYKLTMGQAVFRNYDDLTAGYEFINRGKTQFPKDFARRLEDQLVGMSKLKLTDHEAESLAKKAPFLRPGFMEFFSRFQFDPSEVKVDQQQGDLEIKIDGPWYKAIYWEVPLMTTVSQLYFQETNQPPKKDCGEISREKGRILRANGVKTIDFGTRRSYSTQVHEDSLEGLIEGGGTPQNGGVILGTSNIALALKQDIPMVGTYAHEWVQAHAAIFGTRVANEKAMEVWSREYAGKFGIALTDTFTTDVFLRSFDSYYARLFDGVRQDSGDPFEVGEKIIAHYLSLGIDTRTKRIVFSDSLNIQKAVDLNNHFRDRIQTVFGIGTNFTNDVGVTPLNMVIKLFSIGSPDGQVTPVIKISDDKGKESGNKRAVEMAKYELQIED